VYANAGDEAYALVLLDTATVSFLETSMATVKDPLQRALLWGALWDLVREAQLAPDRFVQLALRELPGEQDEQIASGILSRLTRAVTSYLPDAQRVARLPAVEDLLFRGAADPRRSYGIRRAHLDGFVRASGTPAALATIDSLLDHETVAGLPLGAPTRWSMVTRLMATGSANARQRLAAEGQRDPSAEGARRAFIAGAAAPDSAVKRAYFTRYFADASLNEDWATASLDAFNASESRALVLPYLRPALDSLPWIQQNRRIFYLGSWIGSFLEGQVSPDAAAIVDRYLRSHPDLPTDLRLKVLQAADDLRRTIAIRRRFPG
jgi:aminopeptidase N